MPYNKFNKQEIVELTEISNRYDNPVDFDTVYRWSVMNDRSGVYRLLYNISKVPLITTRKTNTITCPTIFERPIEKDRILYVDIDVPLTDFLNTRL